jgi:hypothetical protein
MARECSSHGPRPAVICVDGNGEAVHRLDRGDASALPLPPPRQRKQLTAREKSSAIARSWYRTVFRFVVSSRSL